MATSFKFERVQGHTCPRCGGNEYERDVLGWKCLFCGTCYPDNEDPDNPAPHIPIPVYVEKRNIQRDEAEAKIYANLIPWGVAVICFFLLCVFTPGGSLNSISAILIIAIVISVILGIRGIAKIRAAKRMLDEIDESIKTNQDSH